jgi:hypothetical protein
VSHNHSFAELSVSSHNAQLLPPQQNHGLHPLHCIKRDLDLARRVRCLLLAQLPSRAAVNQSLGQCRQAAQAFEQFADGVQQRLYFGINLVRPWAAGYANTGPLRPDA